MRKKVICLYLSTLKFPISKNPEEPLVADRHSVINQAVLKPELKVSNFECNVMECFLKKNNASVYRMEVLNATVLGWELQQGIKESERGVGTWDK